MIDSQVKQSETMQSQIWFSRGRVFEILTLFVVFSLSNVFSLSLVVLFLPVFVNFCFRPSFCPFLLFFFSFSFSFSLSAGLLQVRSPVEKIRHGHSFYEYQGKNLLLIIKVIGSVVCIFTHTRTHTHTVEYGFQLCSIRDSIGSIFCLSSILELMSLRFHPTFEIVGYSPLPGDDSWEQTWWILHSNGTIIMNITQQWDDNYEYYTAMHVYN